MELIETLIGWCALAFAVAVLIRTEVLIRRDSAKTHREPRAGCGRSVHLCRCSDDPPGPDRTV